MKRTAYITLAAILILFIHGGLVFSQKFAIKDSNENVLISYKWKKAGIFRKDAPLLLVLKIKNFNPHKVMVSFSVDYYWNAVLAESSQKMHYCIKPKKRIRGKVWDLAFSSGKFTKDQIFDDQFLWAISELEINHHADCKAQLNLKKKSDINEF